MGGSGSTMAPVMGSVTLLTTENDNATIAVDDPGDVVHSSDRRGAVSALPAVRSLR